MADGYLMWQIHGQDHILKQIEPSLKHGRLAHAYLLVGPPHVGKMTLALSLAQSVNCLQGRGTPCGDCGQCRRIAQGNHADVRVVGIVQRDENGPTRTVIGIGDVKEALHQVNLKPYEGSCTVIIFDGAEFMSEEAANALLKVLEEPPPQVLILLLTSNEEALLSTIKSRCRRLGLLPVAKDLVVERLQSEHGAAPELAEQLARLSRGCLGWAINAAQDPQILEQREADLERIGEICQSNLEERFSYAAELANRFYRDRESSRETLYLWLGWWRDLILIKEGAEQYIRNQDHLTRLQLQATQLTTSQIVSFIKALQGILGALDSNANARLAIEALMLNLPAVKISL
ncbi:MAG TPA: DNA polymerase III subunit delta' [Dehalococcoidia bacterium]|nr:DNA polymerase III subunit delta' [Dehalococcoidia bacterium]